MVLGAGRAVLAVHSIEDQAYSAFGSHMPCYMCVQSICVFRDPYSIEGLPAGTKAAHKLVYKLDLIGR